jgi:hypothetical protein
MASTCANSAFRKSSVPAASGGYPAWSVGLSKLENVFFFALACGLVLHAANSRHTSPAKASGANLPPPLPQQTKPIVVSDFMSVVVVPGASYGRLWASRKSCSPRRVLSRLPRQPVGGMRHPGACRERSKPADTPLLATLLVLWHYCIARTGGGLRRARESPRLPQPVWLMELGFVSSADRVTCCNRCTFTASTRLGLLHVPPAPTVSLRWHHGRAPVQSPCGSRNMLRLQSLRADSCTLGATIKACDLFVQPLTVLPAVVSRARLHPLATRE